jgi:HK97 gp10 family phage protein
MTGGGAIELEGLDKLLKALEKCDRDVVDAALAGLEAGGAEIIADAQGNLRENGSVVTGLLRQSGRVTRKKDDINAGFFDTTNRTGYAEYVEYGRRAGKMPPPDEIGAWVYKKFHLKDWKTATSLGWAIAKRIAQEGTQPHPFFGPAVKKNHNSIIKAVRDAVRRKTK